MTTVAQALASECKQLAYKTVAASEAGDSEQEAKSMIALKATIDKLATLVDSMTAVPTRLVTSDCIQKIFLRNGFTIKDGQDDLKPYVYAAARELLALKVFHQEPETSFEVITEMAYLLRVVPRGTIVPQEVRTILTDHYVAGQIALKWHLSSHKDAE